MKKLHLKSEDIEQILTEAQMAQITGGLDYGQSDDAVPALDANPYA